MTSDDRPATRDDVDRLGRRLVVVIAALLALHLLAALALVDVFLGGGRG